VVVDDAAAILVEVQRRFFCGTVGIDEAQFFDEALPRVIDELVRSGLKVIVAGLNTDFYGKPFRFMPALMATADSVTMRTAVCVVCGSDATRSQLLVPLREDGNVFVDSGEKGEMKMYEARCRSCHRPPK
jgi:thymidine kinase